MTAASTGELEAAPPPSAKALGKRPATTAGDSAAAAAPSPKAGGAPVAQAKEREKRVTRSSLGGAGTGPGTLSREGSATLNEAIAPPLYLPRSTPILLCIKAPETGLVHYPPLLLPADALTAAEDDAKVADDPEKPAFRLLEVGDAFGRSRHAGAAETDTSDAYYHRLHRFPEVLEKRSARLERERLIHERSKLILELEELRGRGWVYHGAQGGKGEEERRRRIKEGEDRLQRYDALLPNQPRKSNFLNNGAHQTAADSNSRAGSPAITSAHARSHSRRPQDQQRLSTPLSASGDGSTTIKIKFGAGTARRTSASTTTRGGQSKHKMRMSYAEPDTDEDGDEDEYYYGQEASTSRPSKRDRNAERARAQERVRLGHPARSNFPIDIGNGEGRKRRRQSRSEEEEEEGDWEDNNDEEDSRSYSRSRRARASRGPAPRTRLPDSFFTTTVLRDQFHDALKPEDPNAPSSSRRSSSRLAYAFGQRLPDAALLRYQEFELFGGVAGDELDERMENNGVRLEDMVVERIGAGNAEVWGGRVVPRSALEAERRGPLYVRQDQVNGRSLAGTLAQDSSASEVELPPVASGRGRRRSSTSAHFAVPRLSPQRAHVVGPPSAAGPVPVPPAAAIALGWTGPGGNESSSSLTSLQPSSAEEEAVETAEDDDRMTLG